MAAEHLLKPLLFKGGDERRTRRLPLLPFHLGCFFNTGQIEQPKSGRGSSAPKCASPSCVEEQSSGEGGDASDIDGKEAGGL